MRALIVMVFLLVTSISWAITNNIQNSLQQNALNVPKSQDFESSSDNTQERIENYFKDAEYEKLSQS